MTLVLGRPPSTDDTKMLARWLGQVLGTLELEFNVGRDAFYLATLHAEPTKLVEGMVVLADGTNWNPGSGAGVYAYYGSAWNKLG